MTFFRLLQIYFPPSSIPHLGIVPTVGLIKFLIISGWLVGTQGLVMSDQQDLATPTELE